MDCQDYITESVERKKGQHLQREERGAIQHLKNAGYTNRAIARAIGCSPTTVGNELKRGTPPRKSSKGRKTGYSARRGEAAYKANRKRSRKLHRICHCTRFIRPLLFQIIAYHMSNKPVLNLLSAFLLRKNVRKNAAGVPVFAKPRRGRLLFF